MDKQPGGKKGAPQPTGNMPGNWFNLLIYGFIITFLINSFVNSFATKQKVQIDYSQFISLVEAGQVEKARVDEMQISVELKENANLEEVAGILGAAETEAQNFSPKTQEKMEEENAKLMQSSTYYTGKMESDDMLSARLSENNVQYGKPLIRTSPVLNFISSWVLPFIFIYFIYRFFFRGMAKRMGEGGGFGGMLNVGKSKAKMYDMEKNIRITFADVAGQDEAKESLDEIVDYLHRPERYTKIGAKQPKGALLVGPPGTGKTLLAKAVAGEAKVPFFSLSGSEFVEMYVGVGASRVRDLFEQAAKNAPCIIFIDEIDAIGKSRDNQMGSNDEREQTLNQLLSEMDGFDTSKCIVILAATNRPEVLDKALLRPGRFDRRIIVEKPDLPGRESILKLHAAKVMMGPGVDLREIALSTSGATGADLANMINEAALRAVRLKREEVLQEDLQEAVETIIAGKEKKDRILNPKEKRLVAYHEVGHALAAALQKNTQPVQKITIVPRTMGSLGYTMQMPEEERYLMTKDELTAQIVVLLAGRAAEEVEFSEVSTGATNDIERATKMARSMVTQYGMSRKFGMMGLESVQNQYLDGRMVPTCSEATGSLVDEEVRGIIDECYKKAVSLLEQNRDKLRKIAEFLVEKETITGAQFMEILELNETKEEE